MIETNAYELSLKLKNKYILTYRCSVNLEGTINNLFDYGLTIEQTEDILEDILDNVEFLDINTGKPFRKYNDEI